MKQLKELNETLIRQQAAFEKLMTDKLERISSTLDELLFLAPLSSTLPDGSSLLSAKEADDSSRPPLPEPECSVVEQQCPTSPKPKEPSSSQPKASGFSDMQAAAIRSKSCSRKNFATNLARELFSVEERRTCNVSGACGKGKLDNEKMEVIQRACFEMYPLTNAENHHKAWQECIKAIDTAGRSLSRKMKENQP